MSKRSVFTSITPLPASVTRAAAVAFLHNHEGMIDLNPLVVERRPIEPPAHAAADEHACAWYLIRDRVAFAGSVSYTAAFHDLPAGMQTHCYAPLGVHVRSHWAVAGVAPGDPPALRELGLPSDAPSTGLYLREDVDLRANILMLPFVKRTLKAAHAMLVAHLTDEVSRAAAADQLPTPGPYLAPTAAPRPPPVGTINRVPVLPAELGSDPTPLSELA